MVLLDIADVPTDSVTEDTADNSDVRAMLLDHIETLPWLRTVVSGIASFFGGYALMVLVFVLGPGSIDIKPMVAKYQMIGLIFYNSHVIDAVNDATGARTNLLVELSVSIPRPVYFLVPVVALSAVSVGVGYLFVKPDHDIIARGLLALGFAVGYLGIALAGTALVTRPATGTGAFSPDLIQTLALGFAYPFIIGTIGLTVGSKLPRN